MIIKERFESDELKIFRQLYYRSYLNKKEELYFFQLQKGFEGKCAFDAIIDPVFYNWYILNDLLLECSQSNFQVDKVIIIHNKIFLFEIKNYEGDYIIENDKWHIVPSMTEINNPLLQLKRSEALLRRLIQKLDFQLQLQSYLVFIHPEFHLYNASLDLPIIFPSQIKRFIANISPTKENEYKATTLKLANQLANLHLKEPIIAKLPQYDFEHINKGILCSTCNNIYTNKSVRGFLRCKYCNNVERTEIAVLRTIEEYTMLFPSKPITTKLMVDWCKVTSKNSLNHFLARTLELQKRGRSSYYVKKLNSV